MIQIASAAASLFIFEIYLSVWLSFFFDKEFTYLILGLAMVGLSAGGVYLALHPKKIIRPGRLMLGLAASMLAVLYGGYFISRAFNEQLNGAMASGGVIGAAKGILEASALWTPIMGILAAIPFFIFSLLIGRAFQKFSPAKISRVYGIELACGALGCAAAALALDLGGSAACVSTMIGLCFLPLFFENESRDLFGIVSWTLVAVLTVVGLWTGRLEPSPNIDYMARNYTLENKVRELWHDWNSYSRITYIEITKKQYTNKVMVVGNGAGHAYTHDFRPIHDQDHLSDSIIPLLTAHKMPESTLIMFAGAGRDMIDLYNHSQGNGEIVGVEINPKLVEHAIADETLNLRTFLNQPNVHLEVAEARAYLEKTRKKFDLIFLSWSGTSAAYFTGSVGKSSQFMYTKEALASVIEHLNPGGSFVVMNSAKVNLLATLRKVFTEKSWPNVANAVVMVKDPKNYNDWTSNMDTSAAMIKPDGFTVEDVAKIQAYVAKSGFEIVYEPHGPVKLEWPYSEVLRNLNLDQTLIDLGKQVQKRFSVSDDNLPFSLSTDILFKWSSKDDWVDVFDLMLTFDIRHWYPIVFVFALSIFCLLTTFGPLLFSGIPLRGNLAVPTILEFSLIGFGFMFVEVGLVHSFSLALETPGWTLAIAVAGLVLSTGIGSLISTRWRNDHAQSWALLTLIVFLVGFISNPNMVTHWLLPWPLPVKALGVIAIIFPMGLAMGHQFAPALTKLAKLEPHLIPWAWAFNGAGGAIAGLHAPRMANQYGFTFVISAGLVCYSLLLVLKIVSLSRLSLTIFCTRPIR